MVGEHFGKLHSHGVRHMEWADYAHVHGSAADCSTKGGYIERSGSATAPNNLRHARLKTAALLLL